uniref:GNAT family N-acetyltransferase n=1 Tax=Candidatus Enterococcus willemsii TaxID=1857215 RepID=UPI00403F9F98
MTFEIISLVNKIEMKEKAAQWFHEKWGLPREAYLESMNESINNEQSIPQWYIVLSDNSQIIGGMGIIENDFHDRKDLTPNVCALYIDENYRSQGIAGKLLDYGCEDMRDKKIRTLYLLTSHRSFYEQYRWKFYCMVKEDGETELTRMYIHKY